VLVFVDQVVGGCGGAVGFGGGGGFGLFHKEFVGGGCFGGAVATHVIVLVVGDVTVVVVGVVAGGVAVGVVAHVIVVIVKLDVVIVVVVGCGVRLVDGYSNGAVSLLV